MPSTASAVSCGSLSRLNASASGSAASATAAYVVVAMTSAVSSARRSTARTSRSLPRAYALLASGWMPCAMPTNRALATNAKFATTP